MPDQSPTDSEYSGKWRSRGYLPHFHADNVIQHVTIHLADGLPIKALKEIDELIAAYPEDLRAVERRKRIEALVDSGIGSCVLRNPGIARMVQDSLLFFDQERYRLFSWVIMPNHVHVLFQTIPPWETWDVVDSWKKWTARKINDFFRSAGQPSRRVWIREYWDRFIRDERHMQNVVNYIHYNPVTAHLVATPEEWAWGSARLMKPEGNTAS
ncbi:hypothetical protein BH09SUM1_BH09SUM1_10930 [soil metagenome]